MTRQRLVFVVNDLSYFISHRLPIAQAAQQSGDEVHVVYGTLGLTEKATISAQSFKFHFVPIQRGGTNPLADLRSFFALLALFRRLQPSLVHLITIKPVLYGGIAARLAGVPAMVVAMAGLGFVFTRRAGLKIAVLHRFIKVLFCWALDHPNQTLIFQNPHDRDQVLAITRRPSRETRLIRGSGIDLAECVVVPEPDGTPVVVMAARLLFDKGVSEFVKAAKILRDRGTDVRFCLVGEPDLLNPTSVSLVDIEVWGAEGVVEYFGYRKDVPTLYAQAHIVVLPSYREGLPKSLIEAAACGRPVVTTDVPGCRDAIEPGVTGLLVPPRDAIALADALECLIKDSSLRQAMGKAGRILAEREFCIEKVVSAHLQIYKELLGKCESR
jgi:glycosyltransferase involved in cell wall biosynthesis